MPKWVRVRDTSGHHITIRGDVPEGHPRGLQEGQRRLKQDAVDLSGTPLPPTYRTDLGDGPAPSTKPKAKPRRQATQEPVPATAPAPDSSTNDGQTADSEKE